MDLSAVSAIERPHSKLMTLYALRACVFPPFSLFALPFFYFRYHTMRYRFDDEGVTMRWGILFRREISLSYARIQDIHLTSGFLQRWLGLADLHIQTASGSAAAEMTMEELHEKLCLAVPRFEAGLFLDAHDRAASTAIVTDSACDLPQELIERHRIHKVPLLIAASGSEYLDSLTLDASRLRGLSESKGAFPKTSQPPNHFFSRLYTNLASHYQDIVSIHLSAALSGTYAASAKAAEQADGKVFSFNSRTLSGSLGLLVLRAAEAAEERMSAEEISRNLPEWAAKARIFVSVTSLRYMVKGGRVSPLKGLAAQVLNLKPIVSVDEEGKSILYGKDVLRSRQLAQNRADGGRGAPTFAASVLRRRPYRLPGKGCRRRSRM
ncbi:MAG: DegV family EDD domain-containing protein, partial [Rhodospirillales bacterium]|nr:DegV family EDD domain-containing protein [Rhodospirillales bacterium]